MVKLWINGYLPKDFLDAFFEAGESLDLAWVGDAAENIRGFELQTAPTYRPVKVELYHYDSAQDRVLYCRYQQGVFECQAAEEGVEPDGYYHHLPGLPLPRKLVFHLSVESMVGPFDLSILREGFAQPGPGTMCDVSVQVQADRVVFEG